MTPLNRLQELLEQEDFDCTVIQSSKEAAIDGLCVFLGLDYKKREMLLQILAYQQQVSPEFILPKTTALPYRFQFFIQFPFTVQDLALPQVASLLFFLNKFLDFPGFELDELEGKINYRYIWMTYPSSMDSLILLSILGTITLNVRLFAEMIESLAEGKVSFNDLLAEIIKIKK